MIPKGIMASFLSKDFTPQYEIVRCDYCHKKIPRENDYSLDFHVMFAHMPPSDASREIRRNMRLGHP